MSSRGSSRGYGSSDAGSGSLASGSSRSPGGGSSMPSGSGTGVQYSEYTESTFSRGSYDEFGSQLSYASTSESDTDDETATTYTDMSRGQRRADMMRRDLLRNAGLSIKYVSRLPHAGRFDNVALGRGSKLVYEDMVKRRPVDEFFRFKETSEDRKLRRARVRKERAAASPRSSGSSSGGGGSDASDGVPDEELSSDEGKLGKEYDDEEEREDSPSRARLKKVPYHIRKRLSDIVMPRVKIQQELCPDPTLRAPAPAKIEHLVGREDRINPPPGQAVPPQPLEKSRGADRYFSYRGNWKTGKMAGHGTFLFADGSQVTADFSNGRPNCKEGGVGRYASGARYTGGFKDGLFDGSGVMRYPSGARYEGGFRKGLKHGHGKWTSPSGSVYIGEFQDNLYHGRGVYRNQLGYTYKGNFMRGKVHGQGLIVWPHKKRRKEQLVEATRGAGMGNGLDNSDVPEPEEFDDDPTKPAKMRKEMKHAEQRKKAAASGKGKASKPSGKGTLKGARRPVTTGSEDSDELGVDPDDPPRMLARPDFPHMSLSELVIKMKEDADNEAEQRNKDFWELLAPLRRFQLDRYVRAVREYNLEEEREKLLEEAMEVKREREAFRRRGQEARKEAMDAALAEMGLVDAPPPDPGVGRFE